MSLPALPPGTRKVFIAYLDSYLGLQLTAKYLAQDCDVSGILRDPANAAAVSGKVKRAFRRGEADAIRRALLDSDFVVYQLLDTTDDAVAAVRLLTSNHYEGEKRFVLVSTVQTWAETPALADTKNEDGETELETLTEDQYNRRVPHIKYLAWRDTEKMVCTALCDRLKTFVLFAGLAYGLGEDKLHPLFKQAWTLAPEGLPVFGSGKQIVPMIHIADLTTMVMRVAALPEIPENRYFFAVDDGNCAWADVVATLNTAMGNGKTFRVPRHEFGLHDNVEHFAVSLRIESQQVGNVMPDPSDWVCRGGFAENMPLLAQQYRRERHVEPLRVLVLGPPSVGKTFAGREIAQAMGVPHFSLGDIVMEYRHQEVELTGELARLKAERLDKKRIEKQDERRAALFEERRAAAEAAAAEKAGAEPLGDDDNDDVEEEEEIDVRLTAEEEAECAAAAAEEEDERVPPIMERLEEVKRVGAMKLKVAGEAVAEPPNPKDKKKPAPKKPSAKEAAAAAEAKEPEGPPRLSDRALAIIVRWKLTRTQCRNQGYVLDGFPKTVRQARLLFEDVPQEVPEDPDEPDAPLEKEEKPCADNIFPEVLLHCKAGDAFLLERLQRTQSEHPHNAPEEFQRRLEGYKANFDVAVGVVQFFESARTTGGKQLTVRSFDMEACPLVPPPPPKSAYAPRTVDAVLARMLDALGRPHNFGPTPQDAFREVERQRLLAAERRAEHEAQARERREQEALDVASARLAKSEEDSRAAAMKEQERLMLEQRKGPLKAYLMANVIPALTKGLIEVCNARPEDPVDFLSEWLFKHNPEDHPDLYA